MGQAPSPHIVKQSHIRLKGIVANEQLSLRTARKLGIDTADSFILNTGGYGEGEVLFASKRYDREVRTDSKMLNGLPVPLRLHQEDFGQAIGIPSELKYESNHGKYLKKVSETLRRYSADPIKDLLKLWDLTIFDYLLGNTDNHIKNLSLLYSTDLSTVRLAPAYDLISTVIYDSSTENLAMSIGGKYRLSEIVRNDFMAEAEHIGLGTGIAMKHFDRLSEKFETALTEAAKELSDMGIPGIHAVRERILLRGGLHNLV